MEEAVSERLGIGTTDDYLRLRPDPSAAREITDRLDLLARLFLIGEYVSRRQLQAWIPAATLEAIEGLGLLAIHPARPDCCYSPVALYPAHSLYLVSDRWTNPDLSPIASFDDIVYPAITVNTRHFLETLPATPCETFLDLCSGTGVAALMAAARYAGHAWAFDVTERSALYAGFNRLLNGIRNVTVARGDLYEPAGEQTFDRIVANPPYMPALRPAHIYADGGELGERITRRVVEGLPRYLRPGGCFYCVTAGVEQEREAFEQRLRRWLGDLEAEFDVFLVTRQFFETSHLAHQSAVRTRGGPQEVEQWKAVFQKHGVKHLVYGSVAIERKRARSRPVTVRRQKGPLSGSAELEWLKAWETAAGDPGSAGLILDAQPIASPGLELHVVHRLREGELAPAKFTLEIQHPFATDCRIQPWTAYLLARCDGRITAREHFAWLKQNQLIHPDAPADEFAELLRVLISGGFVEIEGFRPPPRRGGEQS